MLQALAAWLDRLLRQANSTKARLPWLPLVLCQCVAGLLYGMVMGSFGEWDVNRFWYALYAGLKVPLLFWVTFCLCVPVFFVAHALAGLHADFPAVMRAILAAQAVLALVLLALAPVTTVWYLSCDDYQLAVVFNGFIFAIASLAAHDYLRRMNQMLIERNQRHRVLLALWLGLYLFVAIQFAWVMRPFVGAPQTSAQFFRSESWGNAYVALYELIRRKKD